MRCRWLAAVAPALALIPAAPTHAALSGAAPRGVSATTTYDGRVELAWQPVRGALGYRVYRARSARALERQQDSPALSEATTVGPSSAPRFTDASVTDGRRYYYAVESVGVAASPASTPVRVTAQAAGCSESNPVAAENCLTGTTNWKASGSNAASDGIEGFATRTSVEAGESVDLKIKTAQDGAQYRIEIYRSGWYGGTQGRLVSTLTGLTGVKQPPCEEDSGTGLEDCSNWSTSATLTTTSTWVSGVYLLRLVRNDNGADSHILLVVRNDNRCADLTYMVPVTTYQAYNGWGGKSTYDFNSGGANTVAGTPRAVKVSFNRPYTQDPPERNWYTESDVQAVSWLEREGYDVSYVTSLDLHAGIPGLNQRKALLSASHDEYWSSEMRQRATAARDAGVGLFFLGSNAVYWKVRFENGDRVMAIYKSTQSGGPDPVENTGTWRDPAGVNQPENGLIGQLYVGDKDNGFFPLIVSAEQSTHRIWRHTSLAGTGGSVGQSIVGWEWDKRVSNGREPAGVQTFAATPVDGQILQDAGKVYAPGNTTQNSTAYQAASGAWVIATGTNHWSRGLGVNYRGVGEPNPIIMQATVNALRDMDAAPSTPAEVTVDPGASRPCPAVPGPGGSGGSSPTSPCCAAQPGSGAPPVGATPPGKKRVSLRITSIKRRGTRLLVTGTISRAARGKVIVQAGRHKRRPVIKKGRWTTRIRFNRRARQVRVRATWAGNAQFQPARAARTASLRTRR
jgi:hypothetical protein